jgi:hypothetical protein
VTKAASPYLTFYTPKNKCTFKYRALTKPAASLLGVAPKRCPLGTPGCPTASSTCAAGHYREVNTDMKPGPCLYCPPGTYAPKASRATSCKPCPAGTYAAGNGSKSCKACPAKTVALTAGSASCAPCSEFNDNSVWASPSSCQACPANTGYYYNGERSYSIGYCEAVRFIDARFVMHPLVFLTTCSARLNIDACVFLDGLQASAVA